MSQTNPKIFLFVTRHFVAAHRIDSENTEFNGKFGFSETNYGVNFLAWLEENGASWPKATIQNIKKELYIEDNETEVETSLFLPVLFKEEFSILKGRILDFFIKNVDLQLKEENISWIEPSFTEAIVKDKSLPKVVVSSFADRLCSFEPTADKQKIRNFHFLILSHKDWLRCLFDLGVKNAVLAQNTAIQIEPDDLDSEATWENNYKDFQKKFHSVNWARKGKIETEIELYSKTDASIKVVGDFFVSKEYKGPFFEALINRSLRDKIREELLKFVNKGDSSFFLGSLFEKAKNHPELFKKSEKEGLWRAEFIDEKEALTQLLRFLLKPVTEQAGPIEVSDSPRGNEEKHTRKPFSKLKLDENNPGEIPQERSIKNKAEPSKSNRKSGKEKESDIISDENTSNQIKKRIDSLLKSSNEYIFLLPDGLKETFRNSIIENHFEIKVVKTSKNSRCEIRKRADKENGNIPLTFQNMYDAESNYFRDLSSKGLEVFISGLNGNEKKVEYSLYVNGLIDETKSTPQKNQHFVSLDRVSGKDTKIDYDTFFIEFIKHMVILRNSANGQKFSLNSFSPKNILVRIPREKKNLVFRIRREFGFDQGQTYQFIVLDIMYSDEEEENNRPSPEDIYSSIFENAGLGSRWEKFCKKYSII